MILILVGYFLLIELYLENKKKHLIIFLTISCVMFFIYGDILFQYADYYRSGLYFDIGTSKSLMPIIHNKYDMIFHVLKIHSVDL